MPVLVLTIAEDFNKLLKNRSMASITPLSKLRGIVVMTIYIAFMLIVRVLGTEHGGTDGASKMFDVIFTIESRDVRTTKSTAAIMAKEVQSSKVIRLT